MLGIRTVGWTRLRPSTCKSVMLLLAVAARQLRSSICAARLFTTEIAKNQTDSAKTLPPPSQQQHYHYQHQYIHSPTHAHTETHLSYMQIEVCSGEMGKTTPNHPLHYTTPLKIQQHSKGSPRVETLFWPMLFPIYST